MKQAQGTRFFFNVDWLTILLYIIICSIGVVNIYAAVYNPDKDHSFFNLSTNYGKQFIFIISGLLVGFFILLTDAKFYTVFAPIVYGITAVLLVAVLIVGRNVGGNQAWIPLGSFRLQPSEFAKFGTALMLSRYISNYSPKFTDFKSIATAAGIVGLPLLLIMLQPDTGSALVFLSFMFPLYREGLSGNFLLIFLGMIVLFVSAFLVPQALLVAIIVAIAAVYIYQHRRRQKEWLRAAIVTLAAIAYLFTVSFVFNNILTQRQRTRIEIMLSLKSDPRGAGYNVNQSMIAIGSGQAWGRGFLNGTQTKYGYVPEQSTDFIFSTIGEEWGFAGTLTVVALYTFMLVRLVNMAERQRSVFSRVYGYCVASILFFHVFINIGMTIGIVPVIGIPLPFISYGGSSLWSFTILLFIFLKLDSNRMGIL